MVSGKQEVSNAELENFFESFVRQAIQDLRSGKTSYAFYQEQIEEIKKVYPNILVREDRGIYELTRQK